MADLPSGTATFLFTDIEGSTALWERGRVVMPAAVARHLALLWAATLAPETFTAAWEAGSHVDHVTAIAKGLAESQELVQPFTT